MRDNHHLPLLKELLECGLYVDVSQALEREGVFNIIRPYDRALTILVRVIDEFNAALAKSKLSIECGLDFDNSVNMGHVIISDSASTELSNVKVSEKLIWLDETPIWVTRSDGVRQLVAALAEFLGNRFGVDAYPTSRQRHVAAFRR